jgi:hypothetical protein
MTSKTAFLFAALLGITAAQPFATASAAAPNAVNNETVDTQSAKGSANVYDDLDQYRDSSGHPLQGFGYLFNVPGNGS